MTDVRIEFDGVDGLVAAIDARAGRGLDAAQTVSRQLAAAFIRDAKANATGPARVAGRQRVTRARKGQPARVLGWRDGGPGVVTGFLRGSIQVRQDAATDAGRWETTVHPSGPYYRRLELGFTGTDSLGRRYNQPPYPFMRPAVTSTAARARGIAVRGFRNGLAA